jgi:hypothetical protein
MKKTLFFALLIALFAACASDENRPAGEEYYATVTFSKPLENFLELRSGYRLNMTLLVDSKKLVSGNTWTTKKMAFIARRKTHDLHL